MRPYFFTIDEIKVKNQQAGQHWFDKETLRHFGCRICPTVYGGRFFVSTGFTTFERRGRAYSIRYATPDGDIETFGEFRAYATRKAAVSEIRRILRAEQKRDLEAALISAAC